MLWRVLRDIFTTGTRHTDIYLKNSSVLPFWQDNYVGDDDDVVVLSRHVMPFAGTSDEFDRFAAPQRFQFLADPAGRRHEGDETRLVALEPAGADGFDASTPGEIKRGTWADGRDLHPADLRAHSDAAVPWQ